MYIAGYFDALFRDGMICSKEYIEYRKRSKISKSVRLKIFLQMHSVAFYYSVALITQTKNICLTQKDLFIQCAVAEVVLDSST
jgi:hypothetical protein